MASMLGHRMVAISSVAIMAYKFCVCLVVFKMSSASKNVVVKGKWLCEKCKSYKRKICKAILREKFKDRNEDRTIKDS